MQQSASLLPADAAVLASVRLSEVEDGFAFLDLLTGLYPDMGTFLKAALGPLALPSFGRGELHQRGIESDIPMLAALARVDARDWRQARGPMMLHHLVIHTTDQERAVAFIGGVLERFSFEVSAVGSDGKELGTGAKGARRWWRAHRDLGRRAGIVMAASSQRGEAAVITLPTAGTMRIDLAVPMLAVDEAKNAARFSAAGFAKLLAPTPPRNPPPSLAQQLSVGTRRLLGTDASFVVVLDPKHAAGLLTTKECRDTFARDEGAFFQDAAIVARLHPFDWRLQLAFAFTSEGRSALATAASNDGLLDTKQVARAGLGALAFFSPSARAFASVPRPEFLRAGLPENPPPDPGCGGWALPLTLARFWPHLVDVELNKAATNLQPATALATARNVAAAVRSLGDGGSLSNSFAWLLSFPGESRDAVHASVTGQADGAVEVTAFGERAPTLIPLAASSGLRLAGIEPLARARFGLALSRFPNGLGWYYSLPRQPAVFGSRVAIGSVHVNLGRFLELAAQEADSSTRAAVRLAASQVGLMGGDILVNDPDLLLIDLGLAGTDDAGGLAGGL